VKQLFVPRNFSSRSKISPDEPSCFGCVFEEGELQLFSSKTVRSQHCGVLIDIFFLKRPEQIGKLSSLMEFNFQIVWHRNFCIPATGIYHDESTAKDIILTFLEPFSRFVT